MDTAIDTDSTATVVVPNGRRTHAKMVVAIAACIVVIAGAVTGIVLTVNTPPNRAPTRAASHETTPSPVKTSAKTRANACVDGDTTSECPEGFGYGPPLPQSLHGSPYSCLIMADAGQCVVIFAHHPATGWCTEFVYVAPKAPGTEDGWKQGEEDAAESECVG